MKHKKSAAGSKLAKELSKARTSAHKTVGKIAKTAKKRTIGLKKAFETGLKNLFEKPTSSKKTTKRSPAKSTSRGSVLRGAAKAAHEAKLLRLGSKSRTAKKSASKTGSKTAKSYRGK